MKLIALLYVCKSRRVLLYINYYTSDEANRSAVCTKGSLRTVVHRSVYFDVFR